MAHLVWLGYLPVYDIAGRMHLVLAAHHADLGPADRQPQVTHITSSTRMRNGLTIVLARKKDKSF